MAKVTFLATFLSGVALDTADGKDISIIKKQGKVKALEEEIFYRKCRRYFLPPAFIVTEW